MVAHIDAAYLGSHGNLFCYFNICIWWAWGSTRMVMNDSKNICSSGNRSAWYTVPITSAIRFGDWCISSSVILVFPTATRYGIRLSLTLTSYFFTFIFCPPYWFYLWKPKEKCFLFKHSFASLSIFSVFVWIFLFSVHTSKFQWCWPLFLLFSLDSRIPATGCNCEFLLALPFFSPCHLPHEVLSFFPYHRFFRIQKAVFFHSK